MNSRIKPSYWLTAFILSTMLLSACTGVPVVTEKPVATKPAIVTIPVPEYYELKSINISQVVPQDMNGILVYVGTGTVVNDKGESLSVTAIGSSEKNVKDYLETSKFYFEIRETSDFPTVTEGFNQPYYTSVQELLKDEKTEYLQINLDLPAEIKKMYPKGNVLVIIDPLISENQAHIYTFEDPASNNAQVNIFSSLGEVEGTLYLHGAAISGQTQSVIANEIKFLSGTGQGSYDLIIRGLEGVNQYEITGTWQVGLEAPSPTPPKYLDLAGNPEDWLPASDMIPSDLTLTSSKPVSNADVASDYDNITEHETRLNNWGRILGYEHKYTNKNDCAYKTGLNQIYAETILMKDEWGAMQYMSWLEEEDKTWENTKSYDVLDGLGDAAYVIWYEEKDGCDTPNDLIRVSIHFRHYNVIGFVYVDAVLGTISNNDLWESALKLAVQC